jgi:hypothetical protein
MLDTQIRSQIAKYIEGAITLDTFQKWFIPIAWEIEQPEVSIDTVDLVNKIELVLAEYTSEHVTEDELRDELRLFVRRRQVASASTGTTQSYSYSTPTPSGLSGLIIPVVY